MFLLIDNYDSFTFNLVQAFLQLGRTPVVVRNDDPTLLQLAHNTDLEMVCISPGPGRPEHAGLCLEFLAKLPQSVPVLGVCLGHQILGLFAGAQVVIGPHIKHGKQSAIFHNQQGLFQGLPSPMQAGRYHSLLVTEDNAARLLEITAKTAEGEAMALRFTDRPWAGVQFHPESVLTPDGLRLLANFPSALLVGQDAVCGKTAYASPASRLPFQAPRPPLRAAVVIENLAKGIDLEQEMAEEAFSRLMDGEFSTAQAGALLLGLRAKGETPVEISAAVNAILHRAIPVPPVSGPCIDIVGTGGDNKGCFNCSTATSLVLAAMGHKVLKHGNRSVSSRCGSADVLEQLGIPVDTPPENVPDALEKNKFVFLFAPRYHPAFRHVMSVRQELGVRTLFNLLGPLVNPASPTHHFLGVSTREQLELVAKTLALTSRGTGAVVYGDGGYDELTTTGTASVVFVSGGQTRPGCLNPQEFGFAPCSEKDLTVEGPAEAATVLRALLRGEGPQAMLDMLALNLGFALYLITGDGNDDAEVDAVCGFDKGRMHAAMCEARNAVASGVGRSFCHA